MQEIIKVMQPKLLFLQKLNELAKANNARDLKYLRNALHSVYKEQDLGKFKSKLEDITIILNQPEQLEAYCEEQQLKAPPREFTGNENLFDDLDEDELMMAA